VETNRRAVVFPLREAYAFAGQHNLSAQAANIRDMEIEWDLSYTSTVRRGRMLDLFEDKGLLSAFIDQKWPSGHSAQGKAAIRFYLKISQKYSAFLAGKDVPESDEREATREASEFALESHLRDFLAKNLERIEPGLRLYVSDNETGVEYRIDDGRIDLLAIDRDGKYVVIELKLSRGRNKTLGQLLYYMGWVDQHLGNGPCRGVIIANEIPDDLKVAVSRAPGVFIARYMMSFSVERVK
jgi:endonuclease NucS-like protein